jgi:membrane protein DedA with SNARE-associated domain
MHLQNFIETYGYAAILIGTFLEGETILILGGFVAHRGYLMLPWVMLAAFIGSLCGDQLFFFLGRKHSHFLLKHRPTWQPQIAKTQQLLDRFHTPLILFFRFLYGLRTVAPFVIGMSRVPARKFVLLNALGAAVWATAFGLGGFLFGHTLEFFLDNVKKYEYAILIALTSVGFLIWGLHFFRRRKSVSLQSFDTHDKPQD